MVAAGAGVADGVRRGSGVKRAFDPAWGLLSRTVRSALSPKEDTPACFSERDSADPGPRVTEKQS